MLLVALVVLASVCAVGYGVARSAGASPLGWAALAGGLYLVLGYGWRNVVDGDVLGEAAANQLYRDGVISYNEADRIAARATRSFYGSVAFGCIGSVAVLGVLYRSRRNAKIAASPERDEPEIVGATCEACEKRIAVALDGRICNRCNAAIHEACEGAHRARCAPGYRA